ncbi:MAG: hypothetical protein IT298_17400 [Chloroflexi bacterium]|nr:hypothetical protein [Chloroflexota bacterium]RIK20119.1 MAG: hypothetical protein DCC53_11540 [Chloroflexota bacterium]
MPSTRWEKHLLDIDVPDVGRIQLSPFIDLSELSKIGASLGVQPREFAAGLIETVIDFPKIEVPEILGWPDRTLENVVNTWLEQNSALKAAVPTELPFFEGLQVGSQIYLSKAFDDLQSAVRLGLAVQTAKLQEMVKPIGVAFQESIQRIINWDSLGIAVEPIGNFFKNLPDLKELEAIFEVPDADKGDFLARVRYELVVDHGTYGELKKHRRSEQVDQRTRAAVTTNRLLRIARRQDFVDELNAKFTRSKTLARRRHIIKQAIQAHVERNYAISIPTLFAQIEGILTDAMVLKQLVVREKGEVFTKGAAGDKKLLASLSRKKQHLEKLNAEQILPALMDVVSSHVSPQTDFVKARNAILHGSSISYDRAGLSVTLILIANYLASEFEKYESEH